VTDQIAETVPGVEWCSWCGVWTDHRSGFHFATDAPVARLPDDPSPPEHLSPCDDLDCSCGALLDEFGACPEQMYPSCESRLDALEVWAQPDAWDDGDDDQEVGEPF